MSKGVTIPDNLLQHIKEEAGRIHHGRIIIEINTDKPGKVDVITESRSRFNAERPKDPDWPDHYPKKRTRS